MAQGTPPLPVRVPAEQRDRWRAAAALDGLDLSAWVRLVCDRAAACQHKRKHLGRSGLPVCDDCGKVNP